MARIFKDEAGKVIKTEPCTKPHPRPTARDSKGQRLNKLPEADGTHQTVGATKAKVAKGDKAK